MMPTLRREAKIAILMMLASPLVAVPAQLPARGDATPALPSRLGSGARAAINNVIDSTRAAGLPVTPLVDKAAEGVLKGADDARIVAAVQSLARDLREARAILGSANDVALLGTVASALHAGIAEPDLRRLVRGAPGGQPTDPDVLESALVTAVDLVAKRVVSATVTSSIRALLDRHALASQFAELRAEVDQAIRAGQSPAAALDARTRAHVQMLDTMRRGGTLPP